jgi:ribosome recycling factor
VADNIKKALRDGDIGTDEERREMDFLQKVTDTWTAEVDRVGKHKEQEILEVS